MRRARPLLAPGGAAFVLACAVMALAPPASAVNYRVFAETMGDAYQLVTSDHVLLNRRRLHQYVGFGAYDLLGDGDNRVHGTLLLRFDADFGLSARELEDVPTMRRERLSLQYAYVDARELGGLIDARIGRQLHHDAIDFLMLDGAVVSVRSPWHVAVELLAGLEVKDATWQLNASQLDLDGVRVIEGFERNDDATVALGVALKTVDLQRTRARLGYRRLFSDGRVRQEKIGATVYQRVADVLHLTGTMSFDFYNDRFDRVQAGGRLQATEWLDVELEYVRLLPSFDGDSIFNIFTAFPMNDANLRLRLRPTSQSLIYAGGMARLFGNEGYGDAEGEVLLEDKDTVVAAWGGMAGYWHRIGRAARVHADLSVQGGYGGDRLLVDLGATWAIVPGEWELDGRFTLVSFEDALQPNLAALSVGYQLGGKYLVDSRAAVALLIEHNFSALHTQQLRVFVAANVDFWL